MADEPQEQEVALGIDYSEATGEAVHLGNEFVLTVHQGTFILSVFQVTPPLLSGGTPDERAEQLRQLGSLKAQPLGRFAFSPARAVALRDLLTRPIDRHAAGTTESTPVEPA